MTSLAGQYNARRGRREVRQWAIVLEDLDFLVDCTAQRLVPRDPKQIISVAE
jgi:hypothetical protein